MVSTLPNDLFRTPLELFQRYDARYAFTVDGAASAHDALAWTLDCLDILQPTYWGPKGLVEDFLDTAGKDWARERVWVNPPYSMIGDFLAHHKKVGSQAPVVTWLLPSWTDRKWFHEFVYGRQNTLVEFLPGRPRFLMPDGSLPLDKHGRPQSGKFASMVVTMFGGA